MSVASTTITGSTRDVSVTAGAAPRWRPAVVGGQRIQVQCPAWCAVDHAAFAEPFLEDVSHHGRSTDLFIDGPSGPVFLMSAQLALHPADGRPAHVFVDEAEGHALDAEAADRFADRLDAYAAAVRAQVATLRAQGPAS